MRWADRVSEERWIQGESPRWTGGEEVCWVDMGASAFVVGRFAGGRIETTRTEVVGNRIGSAARIDGTDDWAVACDREIVRLHSSGERSVLAELPDGDGFMNDGICDPRGRFWTGTQTAERTATAALYSIGADRRPVERVSGVTVSNGICFSSGGGTLYYVDTLPRRSIEAFDVGPDGALGNRRTVCAVEGGNPDGLTIDDDGALWVAVWNAGHVRRYAPSGELLDIVGVPANRPTAVALVGSTLLITTAVDPGAGEDDGGGRLYAATASSGGRPADRFVVY
jgi:sugar lactone lactonase YvrE